MGNFLRFTRVVDRYRQLKANGEGEHSKRFGIAAIVLSLLFVGVAALVPLSLRLLDAGGFFSTVAGVAALLFAGAALLVLLGWMILYTVLQLKLNRRAVGFVALAFLLAALAGAVCVVLFLL